MILYNTNTFLMIRSLKKKAMDNITKNRIHNIMYRYGTEENANNFNKIAEHINGKQIDLYKVIFSILENCIIVDENPHSLKIEICSEQYRELIDNISKTFFFKITRGRRVDFTSNLFFTILIHK